MRIPLIPSIPTGRSDDAITEALRDFYVDLSGLELPNLSRLCLVHEEEMYEMAPDSLDVETHLFGITYDTWLAPRIREVATNGGYSLSQPLRNMLTKLTLSLDTTENIENFGCMITLFESVRELCIRGSTKCALTAIPGEVYMPWRMPSVSSLRLEWAIGVPLDPWAADDWDNLLTYITFPNVTTLQIQVTTFHVQHNAHQQFSSRREDLLDALLYERPPERTFRFPNISTFEIDIDGTLGLPTDWMLPIHEFRELQHLALKGMRVELFPSEDWELVDYYDSRRPPTTLQTIILEDCSRITTKGFASFLGVLKTEAQEKGRRNNLERVMVTRCSSVNVEDLRARQETTSTSFWAS